jgi:hypothetical protein
MLPALPVPADVGTFTLTDRTEVRLRDPDPVTNQAALDLDLDADARAELTSSHSHYTLAYMPRLSLLDLNGAGFQQPALMNDALASAEWRTGKTLITVRELGGYGWLGIESLSAVATPGTPALTGPGGQPLPVPNAQPTPTVTVDTLLEGRSNTSVSSVLTLTPWAVTITVGYQLGGGANSASQEYLPFQNGPYAQAIADLRATAHDHLVTELDGLQDTVSSSFYSDGASLVLAEAEEQWKHAWSRKTDTMLAAGVYEAHTFDPLLVPAYAFATGPMAEASLEQRFGRRKNGGSISLDFRLAPFVNQLAGVVDERIQASLQGGWTHRKLSLQASVMAAESTDQNTAYASKLLMAEVDASYAQSQALTFDVGARALSQDQDYLATKTLDGPVTQLTFGQAMIFVAVTVRAVKVQF